MGKERNGEHSEDDSLGESGHLPLNDDDLNNKKPKKKEKVKKKSTRTSISSSSVDDFTGVKIKKKKKSDNISSAAKGEDDDEVSTASFRSTRSTRSKKKKSSSSSTAAAVADDDAISVSSRTSKRGGDKTTKKKKKSSDDPGDDDVSVSKSKRGKKRSTENKSSLEEQRDKQHLSQGVTTYAYSSHGRRSSNGEDDTMDLAAENEALLGETAALRKQLNEVLLLEAREAETQAKVIQLQKELSRCQMEMKELHAEVGEYEDAVLEKDGLIKKLTEAVDSQLDKVEYLELKLQRAEEEFCKMEDELKDMEDEIDVLRSEQDHRTRNSADDTPLAQGSSHSTGSIKVVADEMQRRLVEDKLKRLELREIEVEDREAELYQREQNLLDREQELLDRAEEGLGEEMDQIRIKELRLKDLEREMLDREKSLVMQSAALGERESILDMRMKDLEDKTREQEEYNLSQPSASVGNDDLIKLQARIDELDREKEKVEKTLVEKQNDEEDAKELISELKIRVQEFQEEIVSLKQLNETLKRAETDRRNSRLEQQDLVIQSIHEGNKKQIQELYEENRKLQTECTVLQEQNEVLRKSIPDANINPTDFAMAELQDEIAELREKIMDKERETKTLRDEIQLLTTQGEEAKIETKELETELINLANQLQDTKTTTMKKMEQKDETISFMQNEMVRIMKEKQVADRKLGEKELELKKAQKSFPGQKSSPLMDTRKKKTPQEEAAELAQVKAFNDQLTALDTENRDLQQTLEQARYDHTVQLKAKDAKILEVEEELADVNWEMKARKEADYVSLLKDRKERKKELESTKDGLKRSEERVADLEREIQQLRLNQEDLEKDVGALNTSLMARDSGDYLSGLKRQIRSLKEHNMALERKIEIGELNTADILEKKEEKIASLEREVTLLKNPVQSASPGAVLGLFKFGSTRVLRPSVATDPQNVPADAKPNDSSNAMPAVAVLESPRTSSTSVEEKDASHSGRKVTLNEAPSTPGKKPSLWNAFMSPFGSSKRNIDAGPRLGRVDDEDEEDNLAVITKATLEPLSPVEDDILASELQEIEQEGSRQAIVDRPIDDDDDYVEAGDARVESGQLKGDDDELLEGNDNDSLEQAEDIDTDDEIDLVDSDDEEEDAATPLESMEDSHAVAVAGKI